MNYLKLLVIAVFGFLQGTAEAEDLSAVPYAGVDGRLSEAEAVRYIIVLHKVPANVWADPLTLAFDEEKAINSDEIGDLLDDLQSLTNKSAPWDPTELDRLNKPEEEASAPAWTQIPGITIAKPIGEDGSGGKRGPLRLRQSTDEWGETPGDNKLKDVRGATLGFTDNRLIAGSGVWNSKGVVDYPIHQNWQGGPGESLEAIWGPAFEWDIAQTEEDGMSGVEELGVSIPATFYWSPGAGFIREGETISSRLWVIQGKPYFQSDFSGGHEIFGSTVSAEYVGGIGGDFYLGGFQNIGNSGMQYRMRAVGKVDYSATERGGVFTSRMEGDDWFRVGGEFSYNLRLGAETHNPIDFGVAYLLLDSLDGQGGYSDLFSTHATFWINKYAGLTFEYREGETPVADQQVDMISLGLELKY